MTHRARTTADLAAVLTADADDIASAQELMDRASTAVPVTRARRRTWLAPAAVIASILLVAALAWAFQTRSSHRSRPASSPTTTSAATGKQVTYRGVRLTVPAAWPVIDGAHAARSCTSVFSVQSNRVFLGESRQGIPHCPPSIPGRTIPATDGVWMQPGGSTPPARSNLIRHAGRTIYLSNDSESSVNAWYHGVSITIGIGPDPAVERAILASISYDGTAADTAVLGRCPPGGPAPTKAPDPTRVTTTVVLDDQNARLDPLRAAVRPRVSAQAVWDRFRRESGQDGGGADGWTIRFGSYSAQTPAHINRDNTTTPWYTRVPTWLIERKGIQTDYGPCGTTILAPYNADTGHGMGVTIIG